MKIIIPMAGWGSRLRPHTLTVPKPMLNIAGKTIVERLIENIANTIDCKIEGISFIIREDFGTHIENQLNEIAKKYNTQSFIHYQSEPLGTAHAIYCAAEQLNGPLIVGFADTMFTADFSINQSADAVIWVKQIDDPSAFGVVTLDPEGWISGFVEKPKDYVSDLAIIGIYYFKDGAKLRQDIEAIITQGIKEKGEYQLTTVLENMRLEGKKMGAGKVSEWLDCGNKNATIESNTAVLNTQGHQVAADANIVNSVIIPPCYIASGVDINHSVIGPNVSIGSETMIRCSNIDHSIIQNNTKIVNYVLTNTMIGAHAVLDTKPRELSIGDFNQIS